MRFNTVINLLKTEDGINENGFPELLVISQKTVFGSKKSIQSREFYLAAQSGFTLELMFEIFKGEYESEKYLEYESKRYKIIRTFEKDKYIELMCQAYDAAPLRT
jgi:hypothetical protein